MTLKIRINHRINTIRHIEYNYRTVYIERQYRVCTVVSLEKYKEKANNPRRTVYYLMPVKTTQNRNFVATEPDTHLSWLRRQPGEAA